MALYDMTGRRKILDFRSKILDCEMRNVKSWACEVLIQWNVEFTCDRK